MNDNGMTLADFAYKMLFVIDSYNKREDSMKACIKVSTTIPSLKHNGNLNYNIEWDYKQQKWMIENEECTQYDISSSTLMSWYRDLMNINVITLMDWEALD